VVVSLGQIEYDDSSTFTQTIMKHVVGYV